MQGSLKFKACEQYEWEAISSAALLAFEKNKNESKLACEYLERASEIIRAKKRQSELKSISSLYGEYLSCDVYYLTNALNRYYNIGILFYNKKNYSGAAEPMLKCCEVYEEWGKTNPIDEKALAKRKELVSICRQKSNDVDVSWFYFESNTCNMLIFDVGRIERDWRRYFEDHNGRQGRGSSFSQEILRH